MRLNDQLQQYVCLVEGKWVPCTLAQLEPGDIAMAIKPGRPGNPFIVDCEPHVTSKKCVVDVPHYYAPEPYVNPRKHFELLALMDALYMIGATNVCLPSDVLRETRVWFHMADLSGDKRRSLNLLSRLLDRRYFGEFLDWRIELSNTDTEPFSAFCLVGPCADRNTLATIQLMADTIMAHVNRTVDYYNVYYMERPEGVKPCSRDGEAGEVQETEGEQHES